MGYRNAEDILPQELILQIQNYVAGENIYIPQKKNNRRGWGSQTDICQELDQRNHQILTDYKNGMSVNKLAEKYFLSDKSIRRILHKDEKPF